MANSCLSVNSNKKQVIDYLFIQLMIEQILGRRSSASISVDAMLKLFCRDRVGHFTPLPGGNVSVAIPSLLDIG